MSCGAEDSDKPATVIANIFARPPNIPQYTPIRKEAARCQYHMQAANERYTNIMCYDKEPTTFYKIIQIPTPSTATDPTNNGSNAITNIVCSHAFKEAEL